MDSENKETQENSFPPFRGEPTAVDTEKCPNCGDNLEFDPEKGCLKCPSCGTLKEIETRAGQEIAFSELSKPNGGWQNQTHVYHCANCNAEEVLDKREIAHVCPFCGSPSVVEREEIDTLRPNALLPFLLDLPKASAAAIRWAKKRLFAPRDFKTYFRPEKLHGVYLPAFTFDTNTDSTYQGRLGEHYYVNVRSNGKTVREQRTRYFYIQGTYQQFFDDLAVSATDAVPPSVMRTLMHYDYHNCVEYNDDFLYGFSALLYSRDGQTCWADARSMADKSIRQGILSQYHYDEVSYLNVSTNCFNVTYKYLLLPMYTGIYPYKSKTYPFYINGRSGKVKGKSPVSPIKAAIAAVLGVAAAVAVGFLIWYIGQ